MTVTSNPPPSPSFPPSLQPSSPRPPTRGTATPPAFSPRPSWASPPPGPLSLPPPRSALPSPPRPWPQPSKPPCRLHPDPKPPDRSPPVPPSPDEPSSGCPTPEPSFLASQSPDHRSLDLSCPRPSAGSQSSDALPITGQPTVVSRRRISVPTASLRPTIQPRRPSLELPSLGSRVQGFPPLDLGSRHLPSIRTAQRRFYPRRDLPFRSPVVRRTFRQSPVAKLHRPSLPSPDGFSSGQPTPCPNLSRSRPGRHPLALMKSGRRTPPVPADVVSILLVAFYAGRPLYWKLSATIHEIREKRQTVKEGRNSMNVNANTFPVADFKPDPSAALIPVLH